MGRAQNHQNAADPGGEDQYQYNPYAHPGPYNPAAIEPRWQQQWASDRLDRNARATDSLAPDALSMYGDSASGPPHVGHLRNHSYGDLLARFHTMRSSGMSSPLDLPGPNHRCAELLSPGFVRHNGLPMSTATGNVVTADPLIDQYGADVVRLALLQAKSASRDLDIEAVNPIGCERFLNRVWRLAATETAQIKRIRSGQPNETDTAIDANTRRLINRITVDYERFAFHTAVAGFMEFTNNLYAYIQSADGGRAASLDAAVNSLLLLMAPAVPHITAELWSMRHHGQHIHEAPWPTTQDLQAAASEATDS